MTGQLDIMYAVLAKRMSPSDSIPIENHSERGVEKNVEAS
jgi:hypothetical protein